MQHLETQRFFMREVKESDWNDVHSYASQEIVSQYQPWGPNTEKDTKEFVKQVIESSKHQPREQFVFALIFKENKKLIGAGEISVRDAVNRIGEIGYVVNPDYWGKGIATEVAKALLTFGFTELHLHRIYATCDPRNIGSLKVLEKAGMKLEGRMRENVRLKNEWRDSFLFSLLDYE